MGWCHQLKKLGEMLVWSPDFGTISLRVWYLLCFEPAKSKYTLAQIVQKDVKEGDVDWLVASPMLLYLAQNHLYLVRKDSTGYK
jgi:hypothetical protein